MTWMIEERKTKIKKLRKKYQKMWNSRK